MDSQFFYPSIVLDNQDPMMLGRIRARILSDKYEAVVGSITNPPWNEEKDKWSQRDPFIVYPLLPFFISSIPKIDELVYCFFYNKQYKFRNQFYVQGTYSTPTASFGENIKGMEKWTGVGEQIKFSKPLKPQGFTIPSSYGVFPEPGDNAILGRGSADLIVKEEEVLLRAGKYKGSMELGQPPTANSKRAFLQLSRFPNQKVSDGNQVLNLKNDVVVMVQYLIEWTITNPENVPIPPSSDNKFTGAVYLYKLKPNVRVNSAELKIYSDVEEFKSLIEIREFSALNLNDTISFINNFIKACNEGDKTYFNTVIPDFSQFPIFYRPTNATYSKMTILPSQSSVVVSNLSKIFLGIKLNTTTNLKGWGLIYTKDKVGTPTESKNVQYERFKYTNEPFTLGCIGADKICLLTNEETRIGKQKINLEGTLYGISGDTYTDEILNKTSSMVRGEELLELINLITRFLLTHTHAFPGLPPIPITQDGTSAEQILNELQNGVNKILNKNIRLN